MAWYLLARIVFVLAVTYAAVLTHPFSAVLGVNVALGAALGLLMVLIETRLAEKGLTGVRLSCQIVCDHDMTVRAISRLTGSGRPDPGRTPEPVITPTPVWTERDP